MTRLASSFTACLFAALLGTTTAQAQPRLVVLGSGQPMAVSADGTRVGGNMSEGTVLTVGTSVVGVSTPGFSIAASSTDQLFLAGTFNGEVSRWNTLLGTAQGLGAYPSPAPGVPSGTMSNVRSISANGRYIVGLGSGTQFHPCVWDAAAAGGAGQLVALPTVNWVNGQAYVVANDGTVGGIDNCCGSNNRPVVWRFDAGSGAWTETFLPFDSDPGSGAPFLGGSVDAINESGTAIVGSINIGGTGMQMVRWTWNAGTNSWSRITIPRSTLVTPSWIAASALTSLIPTAVSADGGTMVGIAVYFSGNFQRGGFVWNESTGQTIDFYDHLTNVNAPNIARHGPAFGVGSPPALGFPVAISPDGGHIATFAGPQTGFGPPLLVSLAGGACVQPTAAAMNGSTSIPAGNSAFLNCAVTGSETLSIQWRFNGAPISDGPSGTGSTYFGATGRGTVGVQLLISGTTPADSGTYDCVVTNACGSATRPATVLSVSAGACCWVAGGGAPVQCTLEGSSRCSSTIAVGGLGGVYLGDGSTCAPAACDVVTGACCYGAGGPNAACVLDIAPHCTLATASGGQGGAFVGSQTTCSPVSCAAVSGACCAAPSNTTDVVCTMEVSSRCTATVAAGGLFGTFLGTGLTCTPTICNSIAGACCYAPSSQSGVICTIQTQTHCTGTLIQGHLAGIFVGLGAACLPVSQQCGFVSGACCYSLDDTSGAICSIQLQDRCTRAINNSGLGGAYRGDGTTCTPTSCTSVTGACCYSTFGNPTVQLCTIQPSGRCSALFNAGGLFGVYLGGGSTCQPTACDASVGACCYLPNGAPCPVCSLQPAVRCTQVNNGGLAGNFSGVSTTCSSPSACLTEDGACCLGTFCFSTCQSDCVNSQGGTFQGLATACSPVDPCQPVSTGACCRGSTCAVETQLACSGANSSFAGAGTLCNAPGNSEAPCCKADFNHAGGVTVQDIFDFLNAYFASNPGADINASGGVTVQDIFDFLTAYFAGCA